MLLKSDFVPVKLLGQKCFGWKPVLPDKVIQDRPNGDNKSYFLGQFKVPSSPNINSFY